VYRSNNAFCRLFSTLGYFISRPDIFGGADSSKCERHDTFAQPFFHSLSRYTEFSKAADIILLVGDITAIVVIAFVILSSPIRYFIRKRRCCVNVACCGKPKEEEEQDEAAVRRVESVLKCAHFDLH